MTGSILGYAKEVDLGDAHSGKSHEQKQIKQWVDGTKRTLEYSSPGDFVAIKYTGAGTAAMRLLSAQPPVMPSPELAKALAEICDMAVQRDIKLLVDAEHHSTQEGIDAWTLDLMRRYNSQSDGKAVVYNTYQM